MDVVVEEKEKRCRGKTNKDRTQREEEEICLIRPCGIVGKKNLDSGSLVLQGLKLALNRICHYSNLNFTAFVCPHVNVLRQDKRSSAH